MALEEFTIKDEVDSDSNSNDRVYLSSGSGRLSDDRELEEIRDDAQAIQDFLDKNIRTLNS